MVPTIVVVQLSVGELRRAARSQLRPFKPCATRPGRPPRRPRCCRPTRRMYSGSASGSSREGLGGVGPISALRARVTDAKLFENGRHLSAWIGLVPENDSSGGKVKQNGLSKRATAILVNSAMAVVQQAQIHPDRHPWVTKLLGRMSAKQAAIAIANKTARIAWP